VSQAIWPRSRGRPLADAAPGCDNRAVSAGRRDCYHTGGNPGRHELDDTQELNYRAIARAIADLGFRGYVAHEFIPVRDPLTSLDEAVTRCRV
jgi:hypothetical protein